MKKKSNVVQQNEGAIKALKGYLDYLNYSDPSQCQLFLVDCFNELGLKEPAYDLLVGDEAVKKEEVKDND